MNSNDICVVFLCGKKQVGKDTIGEYLKQKYNFVNLAFADPLKSVISTAFPGITKEELYGTNEQKETVNEFWQYSPRQLMELVGTDLFRVRLSQLCPEIGNMVWVKNMSRRIDELIKNGQKRIVITDGRFQNEADFIKKYHNTISIKIERPNIGNESQHISNTESDHIKTDYNIINNTTKEELFDKIDKILNL